VRCAHGRGDVIGVASGGGGCCFLGGRIDDLEGSAGQSVSKLAADEMPGG
jgi:hypothetical protein